MKKTILCMGTLDTKGGEIQYLKELIESKDCSTLTMDVGCLKKSSFTADIPAEEVARAAGSSIQEVRRFDEAGPAAEIMTSGAVKIVRDLFDGRKFQGITSIGGGMGCTIASAAMREVPWGIPKLLVGSQKILQAGTKGYVGTSDITLMISVADISGLNWMVRQTLKNAAMAITGMVVFSDVEKGPKKQLMLMSVLSTTEKCALKVEALLEAKEVEIVRFHAVGVGGMSLERMIATYPVIGVVELALNEIGSTLFGGASVVGPERLETAGKKGIPQIITPGNIDFLNCIEPETVPEQFKNRKTCFHNPLATLPRVNANELKVVGETVARKLNKATGPVKILIPLRGFSSLDREGALLYDPEADKVFINSLKRYLNQAVELKEIDAHINDDEFATVLAEEIIQMFGI